jgi:hypothetical protein
MTVSAARSSPISIVGALAGADIVTTVANVSVDSTPQRLAAVRDQLRLLADYL